MPDPGPMRLGTLDLRPTAERPELLAEPTRDALARNGSLPAFVAPIDPALSDTAAFCAAYQVSPAESANCVVVTGKRAGIQRWAAAVVLATTRADINGLVRQHLDVRKVSFASMDEAVGRTGMEYGGITPIGLDPSWPVLIDSAVTTVGPVIIGSGIRASKIAIDGAHLAHLPNAVVLENLGRPIEPN